MSGVRVISRVEPRLLEREAELETLVGFIADTRAGAGSLLVIEGPAGIGKTRLLAAARDLAAQEGMDVLFARGSELERAFSYGIVRQLFEPALVRASAGERAALLKGAAGLAGPLFPEILGADVAPGGDTTFGVLHGLYWLTANLGTRHPLLLVVDDLHWADTPSLRLFAYLVRRLEGLPVSLVAALRPEPTPDPRLLSEIATEARAVLRPAGLGAEAVALLVRDLLGAQADEAFCEACFRATAGNPLLLRHLVAALAEEGVKPRVDQINRVNEVGMSAVSRWVRLQLARLPGDARSLARAIAVLGDGVDVRSAAAFAELKTAAAADAAAALTQAGVLRREARLGFAHPLVRAAVYEDMTAVEREQAHGAAAVLLANAGAEAEEIAAHLLLTSHRAAPDLVEALRRAARLAVTRGAPESAAAYLRRALEEPPLPTARAPVLFELGLAERRLDAPSAGEHLREACELASDPITRAQAALEYGRALFYMNRPQEATNVFVDAVSRIGDVEPDLRERLEAEIIFTAEYEPNLHWIASQRIAQIRQRELHGGTGTNLLLTAFAIHQAARGHGRDDAVDLAKRALAGGVLLREGGPASINATNVLLGAGDIERSRALYDEALVEARRQGDVFNVGALLGFRGLAALLAGDLLDAETDLREALGLSETSGLRAGLPYHAAFLAEVLAERGEFDEAATALSLVPLEPQGVVSLHFSFLLRSTGILALARGQPEDALAAFMRAGRSMAAIEVELSGFMPWRSHAAWALTALGRTEEARSLAKEGLETAQRWGAPHVVGLALRILGLAEGSNEGEALLREAVSVLADSPARLEYAKALVEFGAALRRANRRADARQPLRKGLELATNCGATSLAERAEAELLATGARRLRRIALTGVESLTPSERRVSIMAAEGQTNREIAQALFVTPKTVEVHLSSAYRKLGIASRSKLASALTNGQ